MKVVAIVGMPGSGKSEVARVFAGNGYAIIRFGDVTDEEVRRRGLQLNESNERLVREELRKKYGMSAYAVLNLERIEAALKKSNVVVDGLYSWEEYRYLSEKLPHTFEVLAVWASPQTRYERLQSRKVRPLTPDQARARDFAEIENVNKGGPIAMSGYVVKNDSTLESLAEQTENIVKAMG